MRRVENSELTLASWHTVIIDERIVIFLNYTVCKAVLLLKLNLF